MREATLVKEFGEENAASSEVNVVELEVLRAGIAEKKRLVADLQGEFDDRWEGYQGLTVECTG